VEIAPFQIKLSSIHCCEIQSIKPRLSNEGKGKVVSMSVQSAFGKDPEKGREAAAPSNIKTL
jgi:hypothetical protein